MGALYFLAKNMLEVLFISLGRERAYPFQWHWAAMCQNTEKKEEQKM